MNQLTTYWLSILCGMVKSAARAVVFSAAEDKASYTPTAFWPEDNIDVKEFIPAVKTALFKKNASCFNKIPATLKQVNPLIS